MNQPALPVEAAVSPKTSSKRRLVVAAKLLLSIAMLAEIYRRVLSRDGAEDVVRQLSELRWDWFAAAVVMQLLAISCGVLRWRRLLQGQSMQAPFRFLASSWMIGRFWGAVTPGGLGLDGWRFYETVKHTGKTARATALVGVEKILGQLGFGVVVLVGSVFGLQFLGLYGVLLVNGMFAAIVTVGLTLLARPTIVRTLSRRLPGKVQARVGTLVDAVCAYHGKNRLLVEAALLGMGVHAFNNFIYVCAARALGIELGVGAVFFASSLQILATILPASINGMGLREAAAVALYTSPAVGLSMTEAVLIPSVGFAAEMLVSACGVFLFLTRGGNYDPQIIVHDPEREQQSAAVSAVSARAAVANGEPELSVASAP